jgi:hypothetical protein
MTAKTSGDSRRRVSTNIFAGIQDSFTTQGLQIPGPGFRAWAGWRDPAPILTAA